MALFAQRHREQLAQQKDTQRAQAAERRRRVEHERLLAAKEAAAAALKAVRRTDRIRPGEVEAAEAAYRAGLADLVTFETGERPSWAPPDPGTDPDVEPLIDAGPEPATDDAVDADG